MIQPTIGRKVWFRLNLTEGQTLSAPNLLVLDKTKPMDATVVYVWGDRMVNLDVVDHNGNHFPITSVQLLQDADKPSGVFYCEWIPYQR